MLLASLEVEFLMEIFSGLVRLINVSKFQHLITVWSPYKES